MTTSSAMIDLAQIVGPAALREPSSADLVDGVRPSIVVEPAAAEGVAAVLAWCADQGRRVVARGGGTKLSWGRTPGEVDVLLSTRALNRITRYEPGDLTVSVDAGATVLDLNRELARHTQWLPLDVSAAAATIGGVIATNESGPLRHRYGAPRDVLIGIRIATADGRLASAGGHVVKNVAGYDLGRLMAGSFGSLAVIVNASFKLSPVPAVSTTLVASFRSPEALTSAAAELAASQLDPLALEVDVRAGSGATTYRLLVRLAGIAAAVDAETGGAERLVSRWAPSATVRVAGDQETALWTEAGQAFSKANVALKLSWLPADLGAVLGLVDELSAMGPRRVCLAGRAALGCGLLYFDSAPAEAVAAIHRIRESKSTVGNVVVVHAPRDVKSNVDVWSISDGTALVGRLIKQKLDPGGVLNAGRGPI